MAKSQSKGQDLNKVDTIPVFNGSRDVNAKMQQNLAKSKQSSIQKQSLKNSEDWIDTPADKLFKELRGGR